VKDYKYVRDTGVHRVTRKAAMFPDEEPDDDCLPSGMVRARNERQANEERTEHKRRRGELAPEGQ
jgi:hypothetical protein